NLLFKSLILLGLTGCILTVLAEGLAFPLASVFVGYDSALLNLTVHGLRLYSLSFLLVGFNIFGSAFFTALNNGAVSATISFLRTLVFQLTAVNLLPAFLGVDGIWLSVVAAELLASGVTTFCLIRENARYQYA
ncbi:MAG: MATE family efflux transporter, partial [Lawsonibacter sp.]|nr:MATE family efflux transporter [Lawsonibacter sp.]